MTSVLLDEDALPQVYVRVGDTVLNVADVVRSLNIAIGRTVVVEQ